MQGLLDGDPANNNGGWQWTAGTGTDAAPYFRVLNPTRQGQRFDPDGEYVRRFIPELRDVPAARIHEPWRMTDEEQRGAGCRIGRDYPAPRVDHRERRELDARALSEVSGGGRLIAGRGQAASAPSPSRPGRSSSVRRWPSILRMPATRPCAVAARRAEA